MGKKLGFRGQGKDFILYHKCIHGYWKVGNKLNLSFWNTPGAAPEQAQKKELSSEVDNERALFSGRQLTPGSGLWHKEPVDLSRILRSNQ